jgi:hypothetical protein
MSPSALPLISQSDYPAFQQIIRELAYTSYQEWAEDHAKSVAYREARNGSREIPISPAEFQRWLDVNRQTAHLELLWVCAEDLAKQTR